jgi:prevent-host-death family protein
MRVASVSELKANLSRFLREVKRGGEIQIVERGTPIARVVALLPGEARGAERRTRLIQAGALRPGRGSAASILRAAPLVGVDMGGAQNEERADRV